MSVDSTQYSASDYSTKQDDTEFEASKSKAQDFVQELTELAKTKPGMTVAIAFLGGFVLAQLLGRR